MIICGLVSLCLILGVMCLYSIVSYTVVICHYSFDIHNNAVLTEDDFVTGWMTVSTAENHGDYLYKLKRLACDDFDVI